MVCRHAAASRPCSTLFLVHGSILAKISTNLRASRRRSAFCACAVWVCHCRVGARGAEPSVTSHNSPPPPQCLVCHRVLSAKSCDYNIAGNNLTRAHTTSSSRTTRRRLFKSTSSKRCSVYKQRGKKRLFYNCSAVEIAKGKLGCASSSSSPWWPCPVSFITFFSLGRWLHVNNHLARLPATLKKDRRRCMIARRCDQRYNAARRPELR